MILVHRRISTANNNSALVKEGLSELVGVIGSNVNAAARFLKLYDKATAPTVGTDVPRLVIPLVAANSPIHLDFSNAPIEFGLGIGLGIVTGSADSDNTPTAAGEQVVTLLYR
jgi:hypothetical protein